MYIPTDFGSLLRDQEVDPCLEAFIYVSVVGILIYLEGHYRPDIVFAVHQCERYTFSPRQFMKFQSIE